MMDRERAGHIYSTMARIRAFEFKALKLFEENKLRGSVHLYLGEEAVASTVCSRLTDEDYFARRSFPDEIARNCSNLDSHATPREKAILDAGGTLPHKGEEFVFAPGESHGIPYRCLVPRSLRNAAVAGRSLCADRRMMGSCRMMSVCMSMGEAMGTAAALAAAMPQPDFHAVDTGALRAKLLENGAYLL